MAKEQPKKKKTKLMYTYYEKKGDSLERKNKFCAKCGNGYFMARHSDRLRCGKCGYAEFVGKG